MTMLVTATIRFTVKTWPIVPAQATIQSKQVSDGINRIGMIAHHLVDHVNRVFNLHFNSAKLESGKSTAYKR